MLVSNCVVCSKKNSSLIINKEVHQTIVLIKFKMKNIVKKLLLAGDKFLHVLHLRQPEFT